MIKLNKIRNFCNRAGYGQGIILPDVVFGTTKIGNATIANDSLNTSATSSGVAEGFYSIAYDYAGSTIISYRWTDENIVSLWGTNGSDLLNGYGVGAGSPYAPQALLAIEFYKAVAAAKSVAPHDANISLTGHSLGGGMAGFVGSLYGKSGTLFDNMAFEDAAQIAYYAASNPTAYATEALPNGTYIDADKLAQANAIRDHIYGTETPWLLNRAGLNTVFTQGEFLSLNRTGQQTSQVGLDLGIDVDLPGPDSGPFSL